MKTVKAIFISLLFISATACGKKSGDDESTHSPSKLSVTGTVQSPVWAEEFNTPGAPSPAIWGYDLGAGGWGNNELQYYTKRADNVIISNGTLKIIAKAENYKGSKYTSARLLSKDKFSFKYGRLEVKAKLPAGVGTWPAIWTMGQNIDTVDWPACGEMDIMEHVGKVLNEISATVHYPGHSDAGGISGAITISNATTEFHLYSLEWSPTSIKFFVDNQLYHTVANNSSLPFNQNFFILLNVAMGGDMGGPVDPAFSSAAMEIDYLRLYKL